MAAVLQLNTSIWGDDAGEADPTRRDCLSGDQLSPMPSQPSCKGRDICIRNALAFMEMKIILAEIVQNVRVLMVERPFMVHDPGLTLRPNRLGGPVREDCSLDLDLYH
ncbi:hypothetical protein F4818DRAFT_454140 [Hypoxylon cercidicola]|nr:hypothetical protein F4818DRAFT_454140 [Hypoxylon cercidicola]